MPPKKAPVKKAPAKKIPPKKSATAKKEAPVSKKSTTTTTTTSPKGIGKKQDRRPDVHPKFVNKGQRPLHLEEKGFILCYHELHPDLTLGDIAHTFNITEEIAKDIIGSTLEGLGKGQQPLPQVASAAALSSVYSGSSSGSTDKSSEYYDSDEYDIDSVHEGFFKSSTYDSSDESDVDYANRMGYNTGKRTIPSGLEDSFSVTNQFVHEVKFKDQVEAANIFKGIAETKSVTLDKAVANDPALAELAEVKALCKVATVAAKKMKLLHGISVDEAACIHAVCIQPNSPLFTEVSRRMRLAASRAELLPLFPLLKLLLGGLGKLPRHADISIERGVGVGAECYSNYPLGMKLYWMSLVKTTISIRSSLEDGVRTVFSIRAIDAVRIDDMCASTGSDDTTKTGSEYIVLPGSLIQVTNTMTCFRTSGIREETVLVKQIEGPQMIDVIPRHPVPRRK